VLHLAASTSEEDVALALTLLLESGSLPTFDATRELIHPSQPGAAPTLTEAVLDLAPYDQLLVTRCAHG
jgi:hypothetical protein